MAKKNFSIGGLRDLMRRELVAARNADAGLVTADINARKHEAAAGEAWATVKDELATQGVRADEWCRKNLDVTARSMDRRLFLFKHWTLYETARRQRDDGLHGLAYAGSLIQQELARIETKRQPVSKRSARDPENTATMDISNCDFRTGDALSILKTLPAESVNVCVTSPPYWGSVRDYGPGRQIGHEKTPTEYLNRLTSIFREVQRVLRADGTLWVVIGDTYAATRAAGQSAKNLLMIPTQLAMGLQSTGWVVRSEIVWDKLTSRPESVTDRPTRSHDSILMLCRSATGYHYDADAIREPLTRPPHAPRNLARPGAIRRETPADNLRVWGNAELGRNARTVWRIPSAPYRGRHSATYPPELVRRCLLASCPPGGLVLDCFGGAGTTALVALQLGHRAITIDLNPEFTAEAEVRIANAAVPAATEIKGTRCDLAGEDQDANTPSSDGQHGHRANLIRHADGSRRTSPDSMDDGVSDDALTWHEHAERLATELEQVCSRFGYRSEVLLRYRKETGQARRPADRALRNGGTSSGRHAAAATGQAK